ncbi:type IV pili twitching motility protein PilT [Candidatus Berkelbacteria bacterium CG_4_10_14_0_8_um_filter_35_9_33_8]|uniref:Type IV pili twitching motility protein PilT n=1 Tax=Candidatus Berkelbacteria bacterium CG_4_10_14_0_2_um_filter_35_9_33_12 TaxID=1974499 RepID=A0A2M7W442_9BACT|nr:MAG: type IV pili twitching motility protein PilT [Candidatus Berkelbacteria bacterium CG23_combo_of_CG06-09_8_20_14_all_33_15]PIS08338.1 MAG: type IV pili twitching motility protein PilT [Candidatus Berkelbacteria bacterium CG10_big_fil_rev_8_21_14_0_10_33_10]PIZ28196.1 MAG: type IV pili twitching motility protein PilT [Candidatus Berkelbacteria bacterium CG_4_10_14_0_8_um_filter_35_9_33_8]PJA20446.1 MAG: type IV pili twitching motility protein PilT [Candidatus Berkelbacteria bacterium CG_4_
MQSTNISIRILDSAIEQNASDVLLLVGAPPLLRIDGRIYAISGLNPLDNSTNELILKNLVGENKIRDLESKKEVDFSLSYKNFRIRGYAYYQKQTVAINLRIISQEIKSFSELGLPPIIEKLASSNQGLLIISGPTGHGVSTTLASIINHINSNFNRHIITLENPIEYLFPYKKSIISQREIGRDVISYCEGLKNITKEDPDVIMLSELRDNDALEMAIELAEIGHLVIISSNAMSISQAIDKIIDNFEPNKQDAMWQTVANSLLGIISQRLIPKANKGRVLIAEVMMNNPAIKSLIKEGKTNQIENIIATSADEGMMSIDRVLASLVSKGEVKIDTALSWARNPKTLKELIY